MAREIGTVRLYNEVKHYGFLNTDGGFSDVFFHLSDWGLTVPPAAGVRASFEVIVKAKGRRAVDLGDVEEVQYAD